jgi:hypothetical protein
MTFVPATPIASGKPYDIVDVEDRTPDGLDDFVGERTFGITMGSETSRVHGVGRLDGEVVRFAEKDALGNKDVRVWRVRRSPQRGFIAEASAAF